MKNTRKVPFKIAEWTPDKIVVVKDDNNSSVRILCTDRPDREYSIVGIFDDGEINVFAEKDLLFVEKTQTVWINYYGHDQFAHEYNTKEEADEEAEFGRLACFETEKTW